LDLNSIKQIRKLGSTMSVLYVEDEESVREQISRMLYKMFDNIDIACDGDEALEKYENKNYDLVITDLNMPNVDGNTLTSIIKQNNINQPIIVISANQNVEQILGLIENGISGYILKPIDTQKMFKQIYETVENIYADKMMKYHNARMKDKLNQNSLEEELKTLDPLTHLFNYTHLMDTLSDSSEKFAILININGFKLINEGYSYEHGNNFLFQFATILKDESLKYGYTAYRIPGDDFLLLKNKLNNCCKELKREAIDICKSIELKRYSLLGEKDINVNLTMAIGKSKGKVLENLYKTLDYAKKNSLKYGMFKDIPDNSEAAKEIMKVKNMIQSSLDNDLLVPFFQPIVAKTGEVKHEVLMRIKDSEYENEFITPISFLQIAKDHNYYNEMSQTVILKAIDYAIKTKGTFSLNFSYLDMRNKSFLDTLEDVIIKNNLGSKLIFEIVESDIIDDMDVVNNFLSRFKALGVLVAIDDFGSGYSNFSYIFNINPDFIKLDGSIVKEILVDEKMYFFVETMIKFAHRFDIKVIAEYVSSEEIYTALMKLNVDAMQGYYLGHPAEEVYEKKYA
jgi:EAL domain-containing protein (putative c-di-GMP-specific phosphodiesterase class I)/CheY-like chemotaxis protein